jgi:hypothetical protein
MLSPALLLLLALVSSTSAFVIPSSIQHQRSFRNTLNAVVLQAEPGSTQPLYGKDLDLPDTYVRCGKCHTLYPIKEEDLGDKGRG